MHVNGTQRHPQCRPAGGLAGFEPRRQRTTLHSVAALPTQPTKEHAERAKVRLAAKAVRLGGLGTFGRKARSSTSSSLPLRLGYGIPDHHGPARYLEGSLCRRIRDPASLRPAQLTQTRTATHSNVPPTVSSDQLLLVPLGHTSVVGDRPPHVRGPLVYGRILGLGSLRLRTSDPASRRPAQLTQTRTDSHSNCSSDALE